MTPPPKQPLVPLIRLDWRAYFHEFSQRHGGNPIVIGGRQVFEDGWQYSAHDYKGPEWAPPDDPKTFARLLTSYWKERRRIVFEQLQPLKNLIADLKRAMRERDAPLQHVVSVPTSRADGSPSIMRTSRPLTNDVMDDLVQRLGFLEHEVAKCDDALEAVDLNVYDQWLERNALELQQPAEPEPVDLRSGDDGPHLPEYAPSGAEYDSERLDDEIE